MKNQYKTYFNYLLFVAVSTTWIGLAVVLPDFFDNPTNGIRGVMTIVCYVCALSLLSFFLLYAAGLNRYVSAVFYPIYGIIGAGVSYYRVAYRITVTPLILDCVFHTNAQEALSVISWQMIAWIALNSCISVALTVWRWHLKAPRHAYIHAIVALLLMVGYYFCNSCLQRSLNQRFPMSIVESFRQYYSVAQIRNEKRTMPAYYCRETAATDTLDIVLVLGESMRADHLQLNGYTRETNPRLSQRTNVVSFPNIYSQYTHTLWQVFLCCLRAPTAYTPSINTPKQVLPPYCASKGIIQRGFRIKIWAKHLHISLWSAILQYGSMRANRLMFFLGGTTRNFCRISTANYIWNTRET